MALKYEWGFYPRYMKLHSTFKDMAKTNGLLMSLKSEKLLTLVLFAFTYY